MAEFKLPETRYAQSGDVSIAYQVMGNGPIDIILVPGVFSHIEFQHEMTGFTAFLRRLSTYARVVTFDKRGQGLSDRISGAPTLEERMDDVRAVMDAVDSRRAVMIGFSEGGCMSALFAATYPERVSHLILIGCFARAADRSPDDVFQSRIDQIMTSFGNGEVIRTVAPSEAAKPGAIELFFQVRAIVEQPRRIPDDLAAQSQD